MKDWPDVNVFRHFELNRQPAKERRELGMKMRAAYVDIGANDREIDFAVLLICAGGISGFLAAKRASRVGPMIALRYE